MPSSRSIARATATLPRHWSKPLNHGLPAGLDSRISKRQEGANKTRLVLQNYLNSAIEPSSVLLDSLDPSNLRCEGPISSATSDKLEKLPSPSDERRRLVSKQAKRQSVLPSFFEPLLLAQSQQLTDPPTQTSAPLTDAALTAHNHPAVAFLTATPRVLRRATSFAGAVPSPPTIRVIKPEPECLDDHSNPSSRDPFYYDKVLERLDNQSSRRQRLRRIPLQDEEIVPYAVTAWFADQYLQAA